MRAAAADSGDYILPSGLNDGYSRAVSPDAIGAVDLGSVVGIAWGSGGDVGRPGLINVAVGLRPVEVTRVVARQQAKIDDLELELRQIRSQIAALSAAVDRR